MRTEDRLRHRARCGRTVLKCTARVCFALLAVRTALPLNEPDLADCGNRVFSTLSVAELTSILAVIVYVEKLKFLSNTSYDTGLTLLLTCAVVWHYQTLQMPLSGLTVVALLV